jgi:excinuclease ABC subunit C
MNEALKEKLKHLPADPGAYMMKDAHGEVIYIGKAASLRSRVRSYFQKGQAHEAKVLMMLSKVQDVDWIVTGSEVEALMLECNLIKKHHPWYNVRLRDDKHYPYLCVTTSEPFPRVLVTRRVKADGNRYFGPFADSQAMRESLRMIRRIFKIRSCNKKLTGEEQDRPCLNFHMGQCDTPCSGKIGREEYAQLVHDTCLFLEGRRDSLVDRLRGEMIQASDQLEFERAARLRDQIEAMTKVIERQKAISVELVDQDVIAVSSAVVQLLFVRSGKLVGEEHFFLEGASDETAETALGEFIKQYYRDATYIPREILVSHVPTDYDVLREWLAVRRGTRVMLLQPQRGEKKRLVEMATENAAQTAERERSMEAMSEDEAEANLEDLKEVLGLPGLPNRIEAYDISNIQGQEAVGSMVVFVGGLPAKSHYRRFKIHVSGQPDDYGMMKEVLMRRLAKAAAGDKKFLPLPDLVLVDGGRGQLNAALEAREKVSTQNAEPGTMNVVSLAKRLEEVYTPSSAEPLLLPRESSALRMLMRIRDEAHRFALAYHQILRKKTAHKSVLDGIPGIGDSRRKALIRKFGSLAGVKRASLEELMAVPGITRPVAEKVWETLHAE